MNEYSKDDREAISGLVQFPPKDDGFLLLLDVGFINAGRPVHACITCKIPFQPSCNNRLATMLSNCSSSTHHECIAASTKDPPEDVSYTIVLLFL